MALNWKSLEKIGIQLGQLFIVVAISVAIAGALIFYQWLGLFVGLVGIGFIAFVFAAPLQALLFWLITAPILDFYLRIPMGQGIPDITFTRVTVVTLFFIILLQVALNMRELLPRQKTENCLILFSCLAMVSTVFRDTFIQDMQVFIDGYATPFAFFFLAKNLIRKKEDVRLFCYALSIVGFYLAIIGILQYFADINLFAPDTLIITHENRAYGPFGNSVSYGGVMAILFFGVFYLYSEVTGFIKKSYILITIILTGSAVVLSLTRAVWLSLIVGICLIVYYLPRYRKIIFFFSSVAVIAGIAVLLFVPSSDLFKERTIEVSPIYSRLALYATALNTAIHKPLFGYGFGTQSFYEASREYLVTFSFIDEHFGLGLTVPHNEFLHILVMLGLVGLMAYVGNFYSSMKKSKQLYKNSVLNGLYTEKIAVFYWAVFSGFFINCMLVDIMWFSYFNSLFFIFTGLMESGLFPVQTT